MFNNLKNNIMPGFNSRGPEGNGSMTGRGLGNCRPKTTGSAGNENDTENRDLEPRLRRGLASNAKAPGSGLRQGAGRGAGLGQAGGRGLGRGASAGRGLGRRN